MSRFCRWATRGALRWIDSRPDLSADERAVAPLVFFMAAIVGATMFLTYLADDVGRGWTAHWLALLVNGAVALFFLVGVGGFGEVLIDRLTGTTARRGIEVVSGGVGRPTPRHLSFLPMRMSARGAVSCMLRAWTSPLTS